VTASVTVSACTVVISATAVALDGTEGELETEVRAVATPPRADPALPALPSTRASHEALNLLVVTHHLGYGGAQLWLAELLRQAKAGTAFPCTVVSFGGGELVEVLRAQGVEVHVTSPLPVHDAAAYEGRLAELSSWLEPKGHTAALVNTFRSFPGADVAIRRGLPVVWAIHESWPESLIWAFDHPGVAIDPVVRAIAARSLERAGAVIFESEATRGLYRDRAPDRTAVVRYGVDTATLDAFAAATTRRAARSTLGIDDDARVLLVMGTVEPRKGQSLLAEAFGAVADAHPGATIVFVGDLHTAYSAALGDYVQRAGLAGRVRLVDVTPDALTWYRASDALVCGSDVESLPRSVLDAMALGVPVVATSVFGLAELLDDGHTGLLFEPVDLAAAIGALDRVLSLDSDELEAIGARGRDLVREAYDSSGYAADVIALLQGLQRDPAASPAALLASSGRTAPASAQSTSS